MILYWEKLESLGPMRMILGCSIFIMVILVVLNAIGVSYIYLDRLGGLGGFVGGLLIGMSIFDVPG